jgi:hypothetical protein
MGFRYFLLLSLIAISPKLYASDFDNLPEIKALQKGMPKDVQSFILRTAECTHWGGEEPYDKERANFIRRAVERAGCSRLDADEKRLRDKYKKNPEVSAAIDKGR